MENKFILDACCGGRMMWFNKNNENVLYVDNRVCPKGHIKYDQAKNHEVSPDVVMDFRDLKFKDNSFKLVVFDPPHIIEACDREGYQRKKYGVFHPETWEEDLRQGFNECWRVLDVYGTLIFKWNEISKSVSQIIKTIGREPLFGHKSGKQSKTHWMCFMKFPTEQTQ